MRSQQIHFYRFDLKFRQKRLATVEINMNPFHTCIPLSESPFDEYDLLVLGRKRIPRYADERNWQIVPSKWFEAGRKVWNGFYQ